MKYTYNDISKLKVKWQSNDAMTFGIETVGFKAIVSIGITYTRELLKGQDQDNSNLHIVI